MEKTLGFQLAGSMHSQPTKPHTVEPLQRIFIVVPHWFVLLLCLPFPLIWLRRFRHQRYRSRHGHCLHCGYDLRSTPPKCPRMRHRFATARNSIRNHSNTSHQHLIHFVTTTTKERTAAANPRAVLLRRAFYRASAFQRNTFF
ncbi:MAG TPA: hypothetical protein VHI52_03950 [Verrucomicrobiae bacterium]|nr:hypothetical protein [Verrucomicrobiae bacterium]HVX83279.1 hypothetical protein [Phycisphaerae bacterium]